MNSKNIHSKFAFMALLSVFPLLMSMYTQSTCIASYCLLSFSVYHQCILVIINHLQPQTVVHTVVSKVAISVKTLYYNAFNNNNTPTL